MLGRGRRQDFTLGPKLSTCTCKLHELESFELVECYFYSGEAQFSETVLGGEAVQIKMETKGQTSTFMIHLAVGGDITIQNRNRRFKIQPAPLGIR